MPIGSEIESFIQFLERAIADQAEVVAGEDAHLAALSKAIQEADRGRPE